MKTEIITINGKQYTRIYKEPNHEWIKGRLNIGEAVRVVDTNNISHTLTNLDGAAYVDRNAQHIQSIVTTLDPLPRYPTAGDTALLYEYLANGLAPYIYDSGVKWDFRFFPNGSNLPLRDGSKISHCENQTGERVEVAIEE